MYPPLYSGLQWDLAPLLKSFRCRDALRLGNKRTSFSCDNYIFFYILILKCHILFISNKRPPTQSQFLQRVVNAPSLSSQVHGLWLNVADFSLLAIMCYFLFGRPRALSFHISTSWSVTRSLWPSSESLWRSDQHFPRLHTSKRMLFNGSQQMVTSCQNWQMKVARGIPLGNNGPNYRREKHAER